MIKKIRIENIQKYIQKQQSASLDELTKEFNVSKNTIRRDVAEILEDTGFKKVYGGITFDSKATTSALESFDQRKIRNKQAKMMIASKAASLINDGDTLFIDSGTTTVEMVDFMKDLDVTVITNNLNFIVRALPYKNIHLISLGGILSRKTNSFGQLIQQDILNTYNINKAFMASTGISLTHGVTNALPVETTLKSALVQNSSESILLVDADKFDRQGLMTYAQIEDLDYLITNMSPPSSYQEYMQQNNVKLFTAN